MDSAIHDPWGGAMAVIGDRTVGGHSVPSSWRSGNVRSSARSANRTLGIRIDNDAWGLLISPHYDDAHSPDDDRIAIDLNRGEAHRLAWWILRWWAAEWFGARRWLYYVALHRHLAATRRTIR